MSVELGTKSETLESLRAIIKHALILPQVAFTVKQWRTESNQCIDHVQAKFSGQTRYVIVRSASLIEDRMQGSQAGRFDSALNVSLDKNEDLATAVEKVAQSFGAGGSDADQIFVQPMLMDVAISGVLFTRDLDTHAPYFVVNYDDTTHRTDTVTSGKSNELKTLVKYRGFETERTEFRALFEAAEEIEKHVGSDALDIEFAITKDDIVIILQVRPIVVSPEMDFSQIDIKRYLLKIAMKIEKLNVSHPYLYGERTLLGVMPDWNPAEMIGIKPRPLALSLYKELITDRTWAYQRDNYGYKNLRSYPLLITLIGHPYIDVRVSFNSFIPKPLSDNLSAKLCNYYLSALESDPQSHDKVEFKILFSCYFLNVHNKLKRLKTHGFSASEVQAIKVSLLDLTNNILKPIGSIFKQDLLKIEELKKRQDKVWDSRLTSLEKIYWLIEDCRRYGTLPFAGLARAGFIAIQMLDSLVAEKILSPDERDNFMASLNTIAKKMSGDRHTMTRSAFIERYGHLRPGTYDILSPTYGDAYSLYFANSKESHYESNIFEISKKSQYVLDQRLKHEGIKTDGRQLFQFMREAIEGREYAKFIFTKSISKILELIKEVASRYNLSADDASYIDIRTLMHLYATLDHRDLNEILTEEIKRNRHFYSYTRVIKLPPLIRSAKDVYEYEQGGELPNFITLNRVQAEVVEDKLLLSEALEGKIVFIPSADPGYDWIFTNSLAGLVTMYGGANSHMAIRAAELRIPAVIGAGEKKYRMWSKARVLEIDSGNQTVKIID